MNSLAIEAIVAQKLHGFAAPLSEVSSLGQFKVEQSEVDGLVYLTENGGAWTLIGGGVVVVTLDQAYQGGTTISVTEALGAVTLTGARTSGSVLSVTNSGAGAVTGISVAMPAAGTGYGLHVAHAGTTAGATSVALRVSGAAESTGLEFASGASLAVSNANEARIRYNSGTQTLQVSLNGAAYTDFDTAAGDSLQTAYVAGPNVTVTDAIGTVAWNGQKVAGTVLGVTNTNALSGTATGLTVDVTGTTPGGFTLYGVRVLAPAGAVVVPVYISSAQTGSALLSANATGTLASTLTLAEFVASGVTPGANAVVGLSVTTPASTSASASSITATTSQTKGTAWSFSRTGTLDSVPCVGLSVDLSSLTLGGGSDLDAIRVSLPAQAAGNFVNGLYASYAVASATASQSSLFRGVRSYTLSSGSTIADAMPLVLASYSPTVSSGTLNRTTSGHLYVSDTSTASGTGIINLGAVGNTGVIGRLAHLISSPTCVGTTMTLLGELVRIEHNVTQSGGTLNDSTTGLRVFMYPSGGTLAALTGIRVDLLAGTTTAATCARFNWEGAAGTAVGNGIVNIECGAVFGGPTLSGQLVGLECDIQTNVTPGSNACIGIRIMTPATTKSAANLEGALVINSLSTLARTVDMSVKNTSGTHFLHRFFSATTLSSATTIAHDIDLVTNVTPGALGITGLRLQGAATTKADTAAEGMLVIDNRATLARTIDCQIRNTGQSTGAWTLRYGAATTLAAAVTGLSINLSTNVTPGAFATNGVVVQLPASSAACYGLDISHGGSNTSAYGIRVIMSSSTAGGCASLTTPSTNGNCISVVSNATAAYTGTGILHINMAASLSTTGGTSTGRAIQVTYSATIATAAFTHTRDGSLFSVSDSLLLFGAGAAITQGSSYSLGYFNNSATAIGGYNGSGTLVYINHTAGGGSGTDTTTGFRVNMFPGNAGSSVVGAYITMSAGVRSYGMRISHSGSVAGATSICLRMDGNTASVGMEMSTSTSLAVSNANEGRLRYNDTAKAFQVSVDGGAYANLATTGSTLVTGVKTITFADTPYTVTASDFAIFVDATGGAVTVNLPAATGSGRMLVVKKTDASANNVTLDGSGAETIDGAATQVIGAQYTSLTMQDAASGVWWIE